MAGVHDPRRARLDVPAGVEPEAAGGRDESGDGVADRHEPGLFRVAGERDGKLTVEEGVVPAAEEVLDLGKHGARNDSVGDGPVLRRIEHAREVRVGAGEVIGPAAQTRSTEELVELEDGRLRRLG